MQNYYWMQKVILTKVFYDLEAKCAICEQNENIYATTMLTGFFSKKTEHN